MIRTLVLLTALIAAVHGFSQNGYIKIGNDDPLVGYVKYITTPNDGRLLELWKTKTDKSPQRFQLDEVDEYAIGKDTFLIFRSLKPFNNIDVFFDLVEAKILSSGKVQLLKFENPYYAKNQMTVSAAMGGGITAAVAVSIFTEPIERVPSIYLLREPHNNYIRGASNKHQPFIETINDFYTEVAIKDFEIEHGELSFRKLTKFVRFCNGDL